MFIRWIQELIQKYKNSKKKYQIGLPILFVLFIWYLFCLPSKPFDVPYSTIVLDREGELLGARIATDQQWRFPTLDSIPERYKVCLLAFEDKHFFYHWGVDPFSALRAIKQNLEAHKTVSGASTITMQTIRLSRDKKRTYGEKIIESILATRLEFSYSKKEILNLYASHAPMGGNVVGIAAASWRYFNHDVSHLSWAEAATLAVLPNSPSAMHFGRNRDLLLNKRNKLLLKLFKQGVLSKIDYDLAIAESLPNQPYELPQLAPHLVAKICQENPGKQVRSTLDRHFQIQVENILSRWNAEFSQNEIKNIAAVVIDVQKNEVIAYCGNVNFSQNNSGNQVDILQSPRSTGSILKPFLYCAMMQEGTLLPDQLVADVPIDINGFTPRNFSLRYSGAVPASEALARSLNIPAVLNLRKYSIPKFYDLLKKAGMTTLTRSSDEYGLSLILGGAEGKLWDIACMYTKMAQSLNDYTAYGAYRVHTTPNYVMGDRKEKVETEKDPIFKAGAVWLTFEALTNVNRPEEIDWRSIPSMRKVAWKTGTSFGFRDGWAVGINPKYVVGVWVGNADGEGRPGLIGASTAGMVMFDILNVLPASRWFQRPSSDLVRAEICHASGCLKGMNCPDNEVDTVYVCKKGLNATVCSYHQRVHLSEDRQYRVTESCAGSRGIVNTSWFVLPPSWEFYYKVQHSAYQPLPPYSPECADQNDGKVMAFIYPFPNSVLNIPRQLDGSMGTIVFELAHSIPKTRVFWHLDGSYIGETSDIHKKTYTPSVGNHLLTVVDQLGNTISIRFSVR